MVDCMVFLSALYLENVPSGGGNHAEQYGE